MKLKFQFWFSLQYALLGKAKFSTNEDGQGVGEGAMALRLRRELKDSHPL